MELKRLKSKDGLNPEIWQDEKYTYVSDIDWKKKQIRFFKYETKDKEDEE